jgi:hypothetical protein
MAFERRTGIFNSSRGTETNMDVLKHIFQKEK